LNVPQDELSTSERIFFQLEQAWWYYEDLICDKLEQEKGVCHLPRFANLKPFSKRLFEFSPLLRHLDFPKLWKEFSVYKRNISTYGCILLNRACTHVVLCKLYKSNVWTFPAGKINQNEIGIDAAARETYEETGFDPHCSLSGGLTNEWLVAGDTEKISWDRPSDPDDALTFVEQPSGKRRTLYVCCGVPEDFPFEPVCRKEIDTIEWIDLRDIKTYKSFSVLPFLGKLKRWIRQRNNNKNNENMNSNKKKKGSKKERKAKSRPKSRDKSSGRDASSGRGRERRSSRKKDQAQLVDAGLIESMGDSTRWTEEEMFETNSKLQGGRIVEYDGNPHAFVEKGFGVDDDETGTKRVDPHSFRVVGGAFMNSQHGDQLADASEPARMAANYQPLVRDREDDDGDGLQPFFSEQGATPWGDVVDEAKSDESESDGHNRSDEDDAEQFDSRRSSRELLAMLHGDSNKKGRKHQGADRSDRVTPVSGDYDYDNSGDDDHMMIFATDKEITAKKQRDYELKKKKLSSSRVTVDSRSRSSKEQARRQRKQDMIAKYEEDMRFVHNWVNNLPNPVNFKIQNVDAIIDQHFGKPTSSRAKSANLRRAHDAHRDKENRVK